MGAGGPQAALQNMVMLGLFSYVVDSMQMSSAEASARQSSKVCSCCCQFMLHGSTWHVYLQCQHQ